MKKVKTTILFLLFISACIGQEKSLIVFIGEKISLEAAPLSGTKKITQGNDTIVLIQMDNKYIAKYRILELISGDYKSDTIEFAVFDHYGQPDFVKYKTVMLFISEKNRKYYHQKYQYFDLYQTVDKRWASHYAYKDYNHPYKDSFTVQPEKINFKNELSFDVSELKKEEIEKKYPKPYYTIKEGKAIAVYGNYMEELFELKKQGILKARGFY